MNAINNDKAARKSKAQICSALMKLLKTVPYRKITVSQLCVCAGISRTAFYKNFRSMDAVVLHKLVQMEKAYNKHRFPDGEIRSRFAEFYSFAKSSRDFDLLFVKNNLFSLFEEQIKTSYLSFMAAQESRTLKGFQREYLPEYLSATVVSLLRKWAETGYREPPELMADITARLLAGYQQLLPLPTTLSGDSLQRSAGASTDNPAGLPDNFSDILNNIPTGVCVLFMPDETHQKILFANTQQMRLINPNMQAPEKMDPQKSALRTAYYENAYNGVHPDDLQTALETFRKNYNEKQFQVPPIRLRTSNGDYVWVAIDVTLRESLADGKLFYASYRDVSKEILLQKELEYQQQKNVEQTLLDTIGHLPACSILYREAEDGSIVPERFSKEYLCFRGYPEGETPDAKDDGF